MAKIPVLEPVMTVSEYLAVVAESRPLSLVSIRLEAEDVERALEFYLNNVVLRHPVIVASVVHDRVGNVMINVSDAATQGELI